MSTDVPDPEAFSDWITRPQMLVALSAIVLSVCGLFISIYEASLFRQEQRASVWPHVEVAASIRSDTVRVWVENTGVGPAHVRSAGVSLGDETVADWTELIRELGVEPDDPYVYRSFIGGRVLPSRAPETIFKIADRDAESAAAIPRLASAILEGRVDVEVCYCSVYDECWTSRLQDLIERSRGEPSTGSGAREVDDCEDARSSRI